jgi:hypothetical protein
VALAERVEMSLAALELLSLPKLLKARVHHLGNCINRLMGRTELDSGA